MKEGRKEVRKEGRKPGYGSPSPSRSPPLSLNHLECFPSLHLTILSSDDELHGSQTASHRWTLGSLLPPCARRVYSHPRQSSSRPTPLPSSPPPRPPLLPRRPPPRAHDGLPPLTPGTLHTPRPAVQLLGFVVRAMAEMSRDEARKRPRLGLEPCSFISDSPRGNVPVGRPATWSRCWRLVERGLEFPGRGSSFPTLKNQQQLWWSRPSLPGSVLHVPAGAKCYVRPSIKHPAPLQQALLHTALSPKLLDYQNILCNWRLPCHY